MRAEALIAHRSSVVWAVPVAWRNVMIHIKSVCGPDPKDPTLANNRANMSHVTALGQCYIGGGDQSMRTKPPSAPSRPLFVAPGARRNEYET